MSKNILISSSPNQTRLAVVQNNELLEYYYENQDQKFLRGNIYLGKVIRVEASLQAAFVDFGQEKHGFISFEEIHPDYFRIPQSDKDKFKKSSEDLIINNEDKDFFDSEVSTELTEENDISSLEFQTTGGHDSEKEQESPIPEPIYKKYKIQEVIKNNQILLVQVAKEVRGNKGAALTTFISLAGRFCVLLPNSPKNYGVSRKVHNIEDRQKLKGILDSIDINPHMGIIIRTAGQKKNKNDIKRDYDFLLKTWKNIRDTAINSIAPALIHEEDHLVKRAIRDFYTNNIEHIYIEGESCFRMAKNFINILSITEAKTLKLYNNKKTSLFHYNKVEDQIAQLYSNSIELKSGASIVINITEALIAIDINSSKATKERDIEETALTTNIDSAVLIARHIILRDLSGLIVIDFIDMVQPKNIIKVEKKIKEQLQQDKAKIHIGSIGPFGLLEISRQRIRPSIFETSTIPCPHCSGSGRYLKSTTITYLILVDLQNYLEKYKNSRIIQISCSQLIIKYILNNKINEIISVEQQHNVKISFQENNSYIHDYSIEKNPSLVQKHPIKKSSTQQQKKQYEKNKPHQSKNAPEKHIKNNKIEKKKKDNLDVDKKNQSKVKSWWQDFIK